MLTDTQNRELSAKTTADNRRILKTELDERNQKSTAPFIADALIPQYRSDEKFTLNPMAMLTAIFNDGARPRLHYRLLIYYIANLSLTLGSSAKAVPNKWREG